MNGGESATRGKNILKLCGEDRGNVIDSNSSRRRDLNGSWDRIVNLGGKSTVKVSAGDRLVISTPGGGGYGSASASCIISPWDSRLVEPESVPLLEAGSLNQHDRNQES